MTRSLLLPALALALTGCADARLFHRPPAEPELAAGGEPLGEAGYHIGSPDVLEVRFAERPEWDCVASVDVDGAVPLGPAGRARVVGLTPEHARDAVARAARVDPAGVAVAVADPRAGRVYVSGPENHRQRVVPYRGPERVVEFLWRVGAVKKGCTDLHDVTVVRPNVAAGGPPQTFTVDVEAVVAGDDRTNVVLAPSDEVTVGETVRSTFSRRLPKWLRPFYRGLVGVLPPDRCDCGE